MTDHRIHELRGQRHGDFALPGAEAHYAPDLSLEPEHLDLELRVDIERARLDGVATHTLRARRDGADRLRLHAVDFLDVRVEDADGHRVQTRYDGREIDVVWEERCERDDVRRLVVRYAVEQPTTGLFFSRPTEDDPEAGWWAATDHETERARHWLPTIDLPAARPTLDLRIRADQRFTILGPGTRAGEERHEDGTKTVHWRLEQPCPSYITCFALGDFVTWEDGEIDGIELAYFTTRAFEPEDLRRSFGRTREMLAWMTRKLDHPFPFPKYYQFALPSFGGAMENISLVSWDDQFVLDETLGREWTWLVDVINLHEMAHSYFGDMVVCRDYAHAWLKESWATYMESLWLEDERGADEARYHLFTGFEAYAKEADESYRRPIVTRSFNHSWQMYDRHLYPGGAARLHLLRSLLGDESFFRSVRAYLKRHAFGVVETDDFRRDLEEASGRSLGRFFDQWIHGAGYPTIKVTYAHDPKKGEITFTLEQTQADEKQAIPVFEVPVDVGWVLDGALHTREVQLSRAKHVVVVPVERAPDQVRVDPHGKVPARWELDPGEDLLRRQLREASDVVGRILAARALLKRANRKAVDAVREAYRKEAFWGVRVQLADALAQAGSPAALEAVVDIVLTEQDPQVLEMVFRSAGRLRAPEIRRALEHRLDEGLDLYRARAAAYEALGRQGDEAPWERLREAAGRPDRYGFAQSAALGALAAARREEGVAVLRAQARPGARSERARPAAVRALGALGRLLPTHARPSIAESLADRLRDPSSRVRQAAVAGLGSLGERSALGALEVYRGQVSDQERVAVDRALAAIRKAPEPAAAALEKKVDDLTARIRRLEDTLERLHARLERGDTSE